ARLRAAAPAFLEEGSRQYPFGVPPSAERCGSRRMRREAARSRLPRRLLVAVPIVARMRIGGLVVSLQFLAAAHLAVLGFHLFAAIHGLAVAALHFAAIVMVGIVHAGHGVVGMGRGLSWGGLGRALGGSARLRGGGNGGRQRDRGQKQFHPESSSDSVVSGML